MKQPSTSASKNKIKLLPNAIVHHTLMDRNRFKILLFFLIIFKNEITMEIFICMYYKKEQFLRGIKVKIDQRR